MLLFFNIFNHFLDYHSTCFQYAALQGKLRYFINLRTPFCFLNVIECHSEALQTLTVLWGGMWGAGHMIRVVSPIIFWFPQMCHLSVQLQSSAGQTIRPDCRRQKGIRHRRFAAASRSLRCHRADMTEAWFFSLQREKDRRRRQRISGAVNYLLKHPGWSHRVWNYTPGLWESDTKIVLLSHLTWFCFGG